MTWKEWNFVEERLRFIARVLDGEKMAGLCREFGISRKTGYRVFNRYKDCGIDCLTERSRRSTPKPKSLNTEKPMHGIFANMQTIRR